VRPIRARLGAALRGVRERQRVTQEDLAERSGLSYNFVSEIERGSVHPAVETLNRLAEALGVGIGSLFIETDHHRAPNEYQISRRELQRVRQALESIVEVTESVASSKSRSTPRRSRRRGRPCRSDNARPSATISGAWSRCDGPNDLRRTDRRPAGPLRLHSATRVDLR
jgi:transcriptional regulator with XRE-family HTH domain